MEISLKELFKGTGLCYNLMEIIMKENDIIIKWMDKGNIFGLMVRLILGSIVMVLNQDMVHFYLFIVKLILGEIIFPNGKKFKGEFKNG